MACLMRSRATSAKILRQIVSRGYAEGGDKMDFTFTSANQVFYTNVNVKQVDVPGMSCSFGILPLHVPTLAVLKPGIVTVYEEQGDAKKIFVSSGTVTVNEDSSVQILAEEAHPLENFDRSAAAQELTNAEKELHSASNELDRAKAEIAVEVGQSLVQALN